MTCGCGRVHLTPEQGAALMAAVEAAQRKRAENMPATVDALREVCRAKSRLRDLGWRDGITCPKDGSEFVVVEWGSTGIFTGVYSGEWPRGLLHVEDDLAQPQAVMWKPLADLTPDEEAARQKAAADTVAYVERMGRLYAMTDEGGDHA